ncbi:MAG TPA: tripartite tricarboxylate transporter substrate binding protein [Xanthobacteraceae bacterium]|jgi:tripartite-type tricarboxylate transporter receptor subunit TctC|nr:tripartite tricarboxylate transporter substrate binding protein [Xanthobacteraceae bacterium]
MFNVRRIIAAFALAIAAVLTGVSASAHADNYPAKTITIIAPASPGGVTDMLARLLARRFIADWAAQAIVENKPGANNQVAAEYVARQPGDGYTLFIGPETTFIVNPALYAHLAYDPAKDFTPIAGLVSIDHALVLNPAVPANSVKDLIALGKAKPGQLNYGTYGVGSSGHLNMEMFKAATGLNFVAVHYKGATPALEDVMAGHIQLMFISTGSAMPQAKAGTVRIIGLGAQKRMALLPDVPAIAETVPGFTAVSWFGLFAPARLPPDVVAKINAEVRAIFADPNVRRDFLDAQYFESIVGSPDELTERIRSEEPKWRKLIRDAHITVE